MNMYINTTLFPKISQFIEQYLPSNTPSPVETMNETAWIAAWSECLKTVNTPGLMFGTWDHTHFAWRKKGNHQHQKNVFTTLDISQLISRQRVRAHCTCSDFVNSGFCFHLFQLFEEATTEERDLKKRVYSKSSFFHIPNRPLLSGPTIQYILKKQLSGHNSWHDCLELLDRKDPSYLPNPSDTIHLNKSIWYLLDPIASKEAGLPVLQVYFTEPRLDGLPTNLKPLFIRSSEIGSLPMEDQFPLQVLDPLFANPDSNQKHIYQVQEPFIHEIFSKIHERGRLLWMDTTGGTPANKPLKWEPLPYKVTLSIVKRGSSAFVSTSLKRDDNHLLWQQIESILPCGLALGEDRLIRIANANALPWLVEFNSDIPIPVAYSDVEVFLEQLSWHENLPFLEFAPDFQVETTVVNPIAVIQMQQAIKGQKHHLVRIAFDYGNGLILKPEDSRSSFFFKSQSLFFERNWAFEKEKWADLPIHHFKTHSQLEPYPFKLGSRLVYPTIHNLIERGWRVEIQGKALKKGRVGSFRVHSGIDWFDLSLDIDFGGEKISFSELLKQMRHSGEFITLADGSKGLLDPAWEKKLTGFLSFSKNDGDTLKFHKSQALILDALLQTMPEVELDEQFTVLRKKIKGFSTIHAREPSEKFVGTLRPYQKEGLGWLHFLQDLGINGCLADDMGLGKTVQVLALLIDRQSKTQSPSLVVVPKSLVQNWVNEALKFAPSLHILVYDGPKRKLLMDSFPEYDLVIMTYGVMRRDIILLKDKIWDYVILDESQAIKNQLAQSTKAARILQARHKLALTGTPIENHVGELWSQFEFLNPGILGHSSLFKVLSSKKTALSADESAIIANGLRPFILRRTKTEVLSELPLKTEQTIICEMEKGQKAVYETMRQALRKELTEKLENQSLNSSKIYVLEALLRLRQVACHPALIQAVQPLTQLESHESIKFQVLLQHLEEVIAEGHKALVFSQFTKLLGLLKREIFERGWAFEYLDGKSTRREESIQRFQNEKDVPLFLISLKAGGLGLNLTAADYVYILDPWWNPATENQAIDRAHRIGQTKPVFAYRLIVKDTVEEKIIAMQKRKKDLAEALISQNNSILANITPEDLDLLLG